MPGVATCMITGRHLGTGDGTWYNPEPPNLYDIIHYKWVDQSYGKSPQPSGLLHVLYNMGW